MGRYLVDFALLDLNIAIEVDGAYWHRNAEKERRRDAYLNESGWLVGHFREDDINKANADSRWVEACLRHLVGLRLMGYPSIKRISEIRL